ncbi:hypothetical protein NDU88_003861 [Pleurodeles waltl]|uniref:Uncharacterized protein n=1 Tax=Pleurodeles waltl TaxID=8319 RepID=A0AAV7KW49_PLEWA|nr:hypothetical protein NDU88_003861 [Pleurodeles waltl]
MQGPASRSSLYPPHSPAGYHAVVSTLLPRPPHRSLPSSPDAYGEQQSAAIKSRRPASLSSSMARITRWSIAPEENARA